MCVCVLLCNIALLVLSGRDGVYDFIPSKSRCSWWQPLTNKMKQKWTEKPGLAFLEWRDHNMYGKAMFDTWQQTWERRHLKTSCPSQSVQVSTATWATWSGPAEESIQITDNEPEPTQGDFEPLSCAMIFGEYYGMGTICSVANIVLKFKTETKKYLGSLDRRRFTNGIFSM